MIKRRARKKAINQKRRIMFYSIFFMLFFISVGYSYLSTTLSINTHVVLSADQSINASSLLQDLAIDNTCITKYTGQVTDQVGSTVTASNVYFNNCTDKRNVIFGGFCWQIIRSTETGGLKILYNGEPVNNQCQSNRGVHKGIIGTNGTQSNLSNTVLYGNSFTYDLTNNTFTLVDTFTSTWSDSTYENLLGKYTCYSNSATCTTLYAINAYKSNIVGFTTSYTIGNTDYSIIGTSPYNANYESPAMVGYMFNKVYLSQRKNLGTISYKFGNSFTYNSNTNTYTLSGTTKTINNWSTGYNQINNTHYTCWNSSGTCNTISYVNYTTNEFAVYFDIKDGKGISDILVEMLSADNVNYYNSTIKGFIDAWYNNNLLSYTNKLENAVYCNDRNIINYASMNPNGGNTYEDFWMTFKNYNQNTSLECSDLTDQFSVSNNKAKLTYPVGLIETEELRNLNSDTLRATTAWYHNLTPNYYASSAAFDYIVFTDGTFSYVATNEIGGVRPAISLSSSAVFASGTGTETDPWIVQ